MDNKQIAMALIAVGVVVGLAAILADSIGLGSDNGSFGALQTLGTIVGLVLVIAGVAYMNYGDRWMKSRV